MNDEEMIRRQERLEKCERIFRLWQHLNKTPFGLYQQMRDSDVARFSFEGRDYEVREVEQRST